MERLFKEVKEGLASNDFTEVFGDLHGGDDIIFHASDEIREGTLIR